MPHALFIADLHLCVTRPDITKIFLDFMDTVAKQAESLYILGDLFEYWAGDDDLAQPLHRTVAEKLQEIRQQNVGLFFMHGNRDFLIAQKFADAANLTLIPDPTQIHLYGTDTLLMHGDTLCTEDTAYLKFRDMVRDDAWQHNFLAQPLQVRHQLIQAMRATSESQKSNKPPEIMDASETAVLSTFEKYAVTRIIHGHTHRPFRHDYELNGKRCQRWVLPAWYEKGGYLHCDAEGCQLVTL